MAEKRLRDLPDPVREALTRTLEVFIKSGPRGLADVGLFPNAEVTVAEERCADFGGRFRMPPLDAPVYVYETANTYDVELPLWLEGENDRGDLFMFLEVVQSTSTARMVDLRVP